MLPPTIFFTLFLLLAYAGEFAPLPSAVYFIAVFVLMLRPLRRPFLPVLHWSIVIAAFTAVKIADPYGAIAVAAALAASAMLFFWLRRIRAYPRSGARAYGMIAGLLAMAATAHIGMSLPDIFTPGMQVLFFAWLFVLCVEMYLFWRYASFATEGSKFLLHRPPLLAAAVVTAFALSQLLWVLSLIPVGFLNRAALFGLVFYFWIDAYAAWCERRLSRSVVFKMASAFTVILALIIGLSSWSI